VVKTTKLLNLPAVIQQLVAKEWWPVLLDTGLVATYKKGTHIIRMGERDNYVRLGLSGWTALQRGNAILGLASTSMQTNAVGLDNDLATCDLYTLTEVTAVLLDRVKFAEALMNSPPTGLMAILKMSQRNLDMIVTLSTIKTLCPLDIGLAVLLWMLGAPAAEGRKKIPAGIPQFALARLLGASREEISRKRNMLVATGYLVKENGDEFMDAMTPMLFAGYGF
jgi:CRP-like cAMP-binding protein